jgi:hypothetical protein
LPVGPAQHKFPFDLTGSSGGQMDDIVSKALKEKKELQKRLAEIEQFLRLYNELSGQTGEATPPVNSADKSTRAVRSEPTRRAFLRGPKTVVRVSTTVLEQVGHPLTRGELAAELEERGVELRGKDRESRARYVGTILWRKRELFENIDGKGYWFKDVPIPETEHERRALREQLQGREEGLELEL